MDWIGIIGWAGDIASIIVAISAVGGALWFGVRRGILYLREFVAQPSVVTALAVGLVVVSVLLFVELRIQEIRLTGPRVQSGVIVVGVAEANESGLNTPGNGDCRILRGLSGARVDFEQPFASSPEVLVSLTEFDQGTGGRNSILRMIVTAVDAGGFNYSLHTKCVTAVAGVRAEWIAVAR